MAVEPRADGTVVVVFNYVENNHGPRAEILRVAMPNRMFRDWIMSVAQGLVQQ